MVNSDGRVFKPSKGLRHGAAVMTWKTGTKIITSPPKYGSAVENKISGHPSIYDHTEGCFNWWKAGSYATFVSRS